MDSVASFLWGVATSSHQIEGNNIHNDWWWWEHQGKIEGGAVSGDACNHRELFLHDLQLVKDLGVNSYRFSIEWSRIEPEMGVYKDAEISWYQEIIDECERLEIIPMVTLHHFATPKWFFDMGGFTNPNSPLLFTKYVEKICTTIGSKVPLWCTFNEPMVYCLGSYVGKFMPPAEFNLKKMVAANQNILRAHVLAYDILHKKLKRKGNFAKMPLLVGIAHNMIDFCPARKFNVIEIFLSWLMSSFYNQQWINAILGMAVNPKGLQRILMKLKKYNMPIIITENGIADADDSKRSDFISDHLQVIKEARVSGILVAGYYHWSLIDNFEWINGFGPRFGLYSVDYNNQKRHPRGSAVFYKNSIKKILA